MGGQGESVLDSSIGLSGVELDCEGTIRRGRVTAAPLSWTEEGDALVRGLAHTLSNRVAALGFTAESLGFDDAGSPEELRQDLGKELRRLGDLTRLFKLLPREGIGRQEALQVADVLADAMALHEHHLELRDIPIRSEIQADVLPVRVERWALLRALVLLLSAARRMAGVPADRGGVTASVGGDQGEVWVVVTAAAADTNELRALAERIGGRLDSGGSELRLVMPSLLRVRDRERAERA
jgi:signal transduction histidine kinase